MTDEATRALIEQWEAADLDPGEMFACGNRMAAAIESLLAENDSLAARCDALGLDAETELKECYAEIERLRKDAERYRRAVIDLATRAHGVKRPAWLIATIAAAIAEGK